MSVSVCVGNKMTKTKAHPYGPVKEVCQTGSRIDRHTGRQAGRQVWRHRGRRTWKQAASRPNMQAIRWRDWQAGWSGWQAARRKCKWTARKEEQHSDILTPKQSGRLTGRDTDRQTDRWGIIWLCLPPSHVVHKGLGGRWHEVCHRNPWWQAERR